MTHFNTFELLVSSWDLDNGHQTLVIPQGHPEKAMVYNAEPTKVSWENDYYVSKVDGRPATAEEVTRGMLEALFALNDRMSNGL